MKQKPDFRPIASQQLASHRNALYGALQKALGGAGVLVLALVVFLWSQGMIGAQNSRLRIGEFAPDFRRTAQDGRTFHLADYKGRPVFLTFVKNLENPDSVAALRSFAGHTEPFDRAGAKIFAVVKSGDPAAVKAFHEEKLGYPILLDTDGTLAQKYSIPEDRDATAVVGPEGTLKYRILAIEPPKHAALLVEVSRCCVDDMVKGRIKSVGQKVGPLALPDAATGKMTPLYGDGKQKATAILFISVKCPCSNAYNDRLRTVAAKYLAKGIRVVGVYSNRDETAAEIAAHAKKNKFPFPTLTDERSLGATHFDANVTPEVIVLDGKNVLRYRGRPDGARDPEEAKTHELPAALDALLAGKKPPAPTSPFGCAIVGRG